MDPKFKNLLDPWEKGAIMEIMHADLCYPTTNRTKPSTYKIVGSIKNSDYIELISQMRNGICDDVLFQINTTWNIIKYYDKEYGDMIRTYYLTEKGFYSLQHQFDLMQKQTHSIGFGNAGDITLHSLIQENNLLDSWEDGVLMEKENPFFFSEKNDYSYKIVGTIPCSYIILIQKMRQGICDSVLYTSTSVELPTDNGWEMIRYNDRQYGELIRKFHLTEKGFFMDLVCFADDD